MARSLQDRQARLAEAEKRSKAKQAEADAAAARVRTKRKKLKESEIKEGGMFARDTGLLKLAHLDAEAFEGLLMAVDDPREVERWRRRKRGDLDRSKVEPPAQEAAE